MKWSYFFIIYNLLASRATYAAEIILNNPQYTTPCEKDLRAGTDSYIITALYGPSLTAAQDDGYTKTVTLQILTKNSIIFQDICVILLGRNGTFCRYFASRTCNCDFVDTNGAAPIRLNTSAYLSHSGGIVRGEWQNSYGHYYHSNNITLPNIYDVPAATLELKVNKNPAVDPSNSCRISLISHINNTLELCCSNTASPCYPRMSFSDGVVVGVQKGCVKRVFKTVNEGFTVNVTVSYSVCTLSYYLTRGLCLIDTRNVHSEIRLTTPQLKTPCKQDLRSGHDGYVITATVGPNVGDSLSAGWGNAVSFQILTNNSVQFVDMCTIWLEPEGSPCGNSADISCNCDYVDTNGTAHLRVNSNAFLSHSEGKVRGQWQHVNGTYFHSDNITLPHIYDVTKAALRLRVSDDSVVMTSSSCGISFVLDKDNFVELCCSNTASPCYPRITFSDNVVVENQTTCVNRTFKSIGESFTENLLVSYSVCTLTDYITRYSCQLESTSENMSVYDLLVAGLIIGLVFVLVLINVTVILFVKKKTSDKSRMTVVDEDTYYTLQGEQAGDGVRYASNSRSQPITADTSKKTTPRRLEMNPGVRGISH